MNFKQVYDKIRKSWILSSIVIIVIGLILVLFPGQTLKSISYVMAAVALFMGVVDVIRYFLQDHTYPFIFQSDLVVGLLAIGLGIYMLKNPDTVITILPHVFGVLVAGCGIGNILRAIDAKKASIPAWPVMLGLAVLSVAGGVVILLNPFAALELVLIVIGACLIYEGVFDILTVVLFGKKVEAWKNSL